DQPQIMWHLAELYYEAGDSLAALNLTRRLVELNYQEVEYYESLDPARQGIVERDVALRIQINDRLIQQAALAFPENEEVQKWKEEIETMLGDFGMEAEEAPRTPKKAPEVTVGGEKGIELTKPK
ncbi:MAG: hypothetical protein ACK58T_14280, partial [Phycisphaerae bacterium]